MNAAVSSEVDEMSSLVKNTTKIEQSKAGQAVSGHPPEAAGAHNQHIYRLQKCSAKVALSPVSEIAVNLQDASLDTPKGVRAALRNRKDTKAKSADFKTLLEAGGERSDSVVVAPSEIGNLDTNGDSGVTGTLVASGSDSGGGGDNDGIHRHPPADLTKHLPKEHDNSSRMSSAFTLNSAGRSPAGRRAEQLQRSVQRRHNIAPLRMENKFLASPGKENLPSEEDLSFYHGNSPQTSPRPCSPCDDSSEESELLASEITPNKQTAISALIAPGSTNRLRRPLEDYDPNSMDSGYGASVSSEGHKTQFRFIQPVAPLLQHSSSISSPASSLRNYPSHSSGSIESMDDEMFEMEALEDSNELPNDLATLIWGDIKATKTTPENKRPMFRRCLSLSDNPVARRVKSNLLFESPSSATCKSPCTTTATITTTPERFRIAPDQENLSPFANSRPDVTRCFKRPEPPGISPIQSKRYKPETHTPVSAFRSTDNIALDSPASLTVKRPILQKSISMNDAHIMSALSRSSSEPDLIGDFSKSYILPLTEGRHRDLKSISAETMASIVRGSFDAQIGSCKIIDCRYPYEFEGGHIRGAKNLFTQDQILDELIKIKTEAPTVDANGPKRDIIVFHCEFSSERGPKLSRFLRNHDRILNSNSYPALHYPEIYLLHGGYKDFFAVYPELCDPIAYRPMLDPEFGDAYRHFRSKSKSWNGDVVRGTAVAAAAAGTGSGGPPNRLVKSRSRLML